MNDPKGIKMLSKSPEFSFFNGLSGPYMVNPLGRLTLVHVGPKYRLKCSDRKTSLTDRQARSSLLDV